MKKKINNISLVLLLIVYLFFGILSVFHTLEFWQIMNQEDWAIIMAIANTIAIMTSIVVVMYSKTLGNLIFIITFIMEVLGNVFYSYHWLTINNNNNFFNLWCDLNAWVYDLMVGFNEREYEKSYLEYKDSMKIITSWIGMYIPLMQAISFYTLKKVYFKIQEPSLEEKPLKEQEPSLEEKPLKEQESSLEEKPLKEQEPSLEEKSLKEQEPSLEEKSLKEQESSLENESYRGQELSFERVISDDTNFGKKK